MVELLHDMGIQHECVQDSSLPLVCIKCLSTLQGPSLFRPSLSGYPYRTCLIDWNMVIFALYAGKDSFSCVRTMKKGLLGRTHAWNEFPSGSDASCPNTGLLSFMGVGLTSVSSSVFLVTWHCKTDVLNFQWNEWEYRRFSFFDSDYNAPKQIFRCWNGARG